MEVPEKIDRLARRAEEISYQMQQDRARAHERTRLQNEVDKAKPTARKRFWCRHCRLDFEGIGRKRVYGTAERPEAVHICRCPECAAACHRLITNAGKDRYWLMSHRVRRDRGRHRLDLLQPSEFGFNTMYPDAMKQHIKDMEDKEKEIEREHYDPSLRFGRSLAMRKALRRADYRFRDDA